MQNSILTPITLWEGLEITSPTNIQVLKEFSIDGISFQQVFFSGRKIGNEQVKIYALYATPEEQTVERAALLLLPDAHATIDIEFVKKFAKKGYTVLMPDYRGIWENCEAFTQYPEGIAYANFIQAKENLNTVKTTVKESCWYEWVYVALYALEYLKSLPHIDTIGAIGIRTGGDILWQLATISSDLSCAVPVCAGGWRAYENISKYASHKEEIILGDDKRQFLACLDAQAYAPFVRCPILMLCATNDIALNADRVYDTFSRINVEQKKAIYFATRSNGQLGYASMRNLDLFLAKFLFCRNIFMPQSVQISIKEQEGELLAKIKFEDTLPIKNSYVFLAEDTENPAYRDWRKCQLKSVIANDEQLFYLNALQDTKDIYVFAKVEYENGFSVSSKIAHMQIAEKKYTNQTSKSKILYNSQEGRDGFLLDLPKEVLMADTFINLEDRAIALLEGPNSIQGIYSSFPLKFYRVYAQKYKLDESSLIKLDVYTLNATQMTVSVAHFVDNSASIEIYKHVLHLQKGEHWFSYILSPNEFYNELGKRLQTFSNALYLEFEADAKIYLNNILNL